LKKIIVVANGFRRDAGNNRPEACATNNRVPLRVKLARAIKTTGISMFVRAAAGLRDTAALRLGRRRRCDFFWTKSLPGAKSKIVKRKCHTSVLENKPL
jgi:hypothetical protein